MTIWRLNDLINETKINTFICEFSRQWMKTSQDTANLVNS
jgi:hypothetical protein